MNKKTESTETTNVKVTDLNAATWNVHKPSKKTDETFNGFVESINANGMLHRIVCRRLADGVTLEVVDGHRRLEAAKELGWTEVPVEIYDAMSDDEAQARTITANIQRLENDPLREADAIEKLLAKDKTFEQIAATLGKDAKYVARRARIINLTPGWRKWLEDVEADADTMEMIARHEQPLQDEVFEDLDIASGDDDLTEDQIERAFTRHMRKIDDTTPFDCGECATCPYNTATHGYLFAEDADACGQCQRASCFVKKWNEAVDAEIEKLRAKKVAVKEVQQRWNIPNSWDTTKTKTKKNNVPYVYRDGELKYLVWGRKSEAAQTANAKTDAEKEAEKKVKRAHLAWSRNRRSAYDKIRTLLNDEEKRREIVAAAVKTPRFIDWIEKKLLNDYETYVYDSCCQDAFEYLGYEVLSDYGQNLSTEEVDAMTHEDPAKAPRTETTTDNEEEA